MSNASNQELRVLVVDDTVVYRRILQNVVAEIGNATVVGAASNGRIALERLECLEVDLVLLDVEMPEMNGIDTLKEIRRRWPAIGVVLVSSADRHSADLTMLALSLGALDFVPKAISGDSQRNQQQLIQQLTAIFRGFERRRRLGSGIKSSDSSAPVAAGRVAVRTGTPGPTPKIGALSNLGVNRSTSQASGVGSKQLREVVPEVLLIGCSTGGPQALAKIVPALPADLGVPVLVVQHMPPVFTASLAASLNRASALTVCEASEGRLVEPNIVFIAPGGRHMIVVGSRNRGERRISTTDDPPVNSCRPSVDVLFRSAASEFGGATLSVVLTGMGEDGLDGVRVLRNLGGKTLTQNEESCVVYGMPRAIDLAGFSDESVPIQDVASSIVRWLRNGSRRRDALAGHE